MSLQKPSYKKTTKILVLGPTTHESWCWGFHWAPNWLTIRNLVEKTSPPFFSPKITSVSQKKDTNLSRGIVNRPTDQHPGSQNLLHLEDVEFQPWNSAGSWTWIRYTVTPITAGWKSGTHDFWWRKYINCMHHLRFMLQFPAMFVYPRV